LGTYGLIEMVVFAVAVFVSFLYLISNGALDWGPPKRSISVVQGAVERTTSSTIRRVPKPAPVPEPVGAVAHDGADQVA
jgi:NADH-quinone oxidoreductase subunit A